MIWNKIVKIHLNYTSIIVVEKKLRNKMNTKTKKFVGGLMVGLLITTIGVIIASGQNNNTKTNDSFQRPFEGRKHMRGPNLFHQTKRASDLFSII